MGEMDAPEPAEAPQSPENGTPQGEGAEPEPNATEQATGRRDEFGRFTEGNAGGGRPKGTLSITGEIKKKLEEMSPYLTTTGEKRTYLQLLVQQILDQAVKDGDAMMIAKVWAYVDGLPKNTIDLKSEIVLEQLTDEKKQRLLQLLQKPNA